MEQVIKFNYERVLDRIARAAKLAGRDPDSVRLMVVTKGQPLEKVNAVVDAGARILGENYAEEALPKIQALLGAGISWHMIGHVQSRKAKLVCEYFDYVHSLDRVKLARRLERFATEQGRQLPVLLEFNLSGEATKSGWPVWEESRWAEVLAEIEQVLACPHLKVRGLMTIPPLSNDPEASRPYFRRLRELRDDLARLFPQVSWSELSMGMSADFEVAIAEGATFVRLGRAILGPRTG